MSGRCPQCGARFAAEQLEASQPFECVCGSLLEVPAASKDRADGDFDLVVAGGGAALRDPSQSSEAATVVKTPTGTPVGTTPTIFRDLAGRDAAFASLALERRFVTTHQLDDCIETQKKLAEMRMCKTMEQVLVEKGFLTLAQAKRLRRELAAGGKLREIGGFHITGRIGKGGMGTVYKARQISLDRDVALKILPKALAANQTFIQRFLREARAAAKLRHPNIVQAIDVGEDRGFYFFAMELIPGRSARQLLDERGRLDVPDAARITAQIARALDHAWSTAQMIHRDIKPDNILIDADGTAKLADMGLAKSTTEDMSVTQSGAVMGTPNYISPEQAEGAKNLDTRADIYSLGCTLFHFLTGQPPYRADSSAMIFLAHLSQPVPDPRTIVPGLPEPLALFVMKMMAKQPADRPRTAGEVAQFLESLAVGGSPSVTLFEPVEDTSSSEQLFATGATGAVIPPASQMRRARAGASSHSPVLKLGIALGILLILVLAAALLRKRTPSPTRQAKAVTPSPVTPKTEPKPDDKPRTTERKTVAQPPAEPTPETQPKPDPTNTTPADPIKTNPPTAQETGPGEKAGPQPGPRQAALPRTSFGDRTTQTRPGETKDGARGGPPPGTAGERERWPEHPPGRPPVFGDRRPRRRPILDRLGGPGLRAPTRQEGPLPFGSRFDGKTMKGWSPRGGQWAVIDGAIVGKGEEGSGGMYCLLLDYLVPPDFDLSYEYYSAPGTSGDLYVRGWMVGLGKLKEGKVLVIPLSKFAHISKVLADKSLAAQRLIDTKASYKSDTWRKVVAEIKGTSITLTVDGERVIAFDGGEPTDAHVGFFYATRMPCKVRNIRAERPTARKE